MLQGKLAKGYQEKLNEWTDRFRQENPGATHLEDVGQWILDHPNEMPWELPRPKPLRTLIRDLKQAASRRREKDPQGRTIRPLVPVQHEQFGPDGQMTMDVVWDHPHSMSIDHALVAFSQRDERIIKQRLSATRDLESALDNNPNLAGHKEIFQQFLFIMDEPGEQAVDAVPESDGPPSFDHRRTTPR